MKTSDKIFHWTPRIICILAIMFLSMFAFDVFSPELTIWQQLGALFMHLIPSFILLAFLIVAWKWELVGGFIFILIGLATSPMIFLHNYDINHFSVWQCISIVLMLNFPFVVVGILFIISNFRKKKNIQKNV